MSIRAGSYAPVSALVRLRYRDIDQWQTYTVYRFTDDGVQSKICIESSGNYEHVRFTAEEAIAIAAAASAKHMGQQEGEG